jgi:hypothetical protein
MLEDPAPDPKGLRAKNYVTHLAVSGMIASKPYHRG